MAACIGEFTLPRLNTFNPAEHITVGDVHDNDNDNGLHTKVFALPHTKSSLAGEEVHWVKQDGPTDPSRAFDKHIEINSPPTDGPLFAYKTMKGYHPLM
jgi:hypothetical protein